MCWYKDSPVEYVGNDFTPKCFTNSNSSSSAFLLMCTACGPGYTGARKGVRVKVEKKDTDKEHR